MTAVTLSAPIGPARVDPGDPYHLYRWCRRFGVTEEQLRMAVRLVGRDPRAVEAALLRARAAAPILVSEFRLQDERASGHD
jgi:hypothetical protein